MPPRPRLKPFLPSPALSAALPIASRPPAPPSAHCLRRPQPLRTLSSSSRKSMSKNKSKSTTSPSERPLLPAPSTRWQSDLKARLGKCIMFGCDTAQISRAAGVLGSLATEWRALSAGAEGFLTGRRRGLEGQRVVWGEMDSFGHVNNAHYLRYAESSRVNWILHFAALDPARRADWRELMTPRGTGLIMKTIKADYKFPMTYPDSVSVYHRLRALPSASDTSLILDCVILSHRHRRAAARTEEDVVVYDYRQGRKTPIPPYVLDVFRDTWRLQEEEVRRARARIWGLVREVEALEKETWDKEGAVEDLGAAKGR